jgi:hypothetical protein
MTSTAEDLAPAGVLRAAINLGNPVLAQGTPAAPSGVTVDLAREIGARLGLSRSTSSASTARKSYRSNGSVLSLTRSRNASHLCATGGQHLRQGRWR